MKARGMTKRHKAEAAQPKRWTGHLYPVCRYTSTDDLVAILRDDIAHAQATPLLWMLGALSEIAHRRKLANPEPVLVELIEWAHANNHPIPVFGAIA